jgi:tetratricopeptide (TPR) repeat protein
MAHTAASKKELLTICRRTYANNEAQMKNIKEFERNYSSDKAIWWYTRESCFYKMLNKALRMEDIDTLFAFRFFITDLYKQLTDLHAQSDAPPILRVYRAQCLSVDELHRLHTSVGEFISMNSFLSTTVERKKATAFLPQNNWTTDQLQYVLFEIDIDPSLETKPYADISAHSRYPNEHEVLFMIGCIFRMRKIWREDNLWIVQLDLCAERDHHFATMFSFLKEKLGDETDLCSFGNLLFEMTEYEKAESYYQRLLNELATTDLKTAAACHHGLGVIAKRRGEIDLAIRHHEKSLQLSRAVPNNDQAIAASLHSLANEYKEKGEFAKALDYYIQARDMKFNLVGRETPETASTYYHIARLYEKQNKYDDALEYHNKALKIQQECLPPDHHSIGKTYGCIGLVHFNRGNNDQAIHFYEQSLEIKRKSLPLTHEFIGISHHDLGVVYERMNKFSLALTNLEKALEIYRLTLPPTHKRVVNVEILMQRIKEKMAESNAT